MHRKKIIAIITILSVMLILAGYQVFFKNHIVLKNYTEKMKNSIKNENELQLVDIQSECGKLNGNGNGVQYFGAALVKTDKEECVQKVVEGLQDEYEIITYTKQNGAQIMCKYVEHVTISYVCADLDWQADCYYTIYFYCSGSEGILDINGH